MTPLSQAAVTGPNGQNLPRRLVPNDPFGNHASA